MARHFQDSEVKRLNQTLVDMLDEARDICGFPFKITSGYRTPDQNQSVGGTSDSSHLAGLAVDIGAPVGMEERIKMAWALGLVGFRRIGAYDRHYHVDIDVDKPQNVMWTGLSK